MKAVRKAKLSRTTLLTPLEAAMLYMAAIASGKLSGEMAEVGVAYGGSAKLICAANPNARMHLFDTFEGLPQPSEIDRKFTKGAFASRLEVVRQYLSGCNAVFYQGLFPSTAGPVESLTFSFVHLDVDLYQSTADSLCFFYPRMVRGGIIVSHDYSLAEGVRRAFDEFFIHKPEPVVELPGNQCMIIKTGEQ